eukprot:5828996-Amphidinium_carterae.1
MKGRVVNEPAQTLPMIHQRMANACSGWSFSQSPRFASFASDQSYMNGELVAKRLHQALLSKDSFASTKKVVLPCHLR